ncbi:hypothetical protein HDU82_000270 [Entophlyctis luteolus]|nr:hypothetical protein HDU82_000270 [Entophlyctis luteolus]
MTQTVNNLQQQLDSSSHAKVLRLATIAAEVTLHMMYKAAAMRFPTQMPYETTVIPIPSSPYYGVCGECNLSPSTDSNRAYVNDCNGAVCEAPSLFTPNMEQFDSPVMMETPSSSSKAVAPGFSLAEGHTRSSFATQDEFASIYMADYENIRKMVVVALTTLERPMHVVTLGLYFAHRLLMADSGKGWGWAQGKCGKRVFLAGMMLADVVLADAALQGRQWAWADAEAGQVRRWALQTVGHDVSVRVEEYTAWMASINAFMARRDAAQCQY